MEMTSKERMIAALERRIPDRLPVTTHHIMTSYLEEFQDGMETQQFFDRFKLDPILWLNAFKPDPGQWFCDANGLRIISDSWRISVEMLDNCRYTVWRYTINTPDGDLVAILQSNVHTSYIVEHLVKAPHDMDLIIKYAPFYTCDVEAVNAAADAFGQRGLVRGSIPSFDIFGQPGCWQDLACLVGIEPLILATYDDPNWVHQSLAFLRDRKLHYTKSLTGATYDILELGGGDASTTVISPALFREFVAPYDAPIIAAARCSGQRIVYHTCGGMMPILEDIVAMEPHAIETLTPPAMGGDVDLKEAKRRVGAKVCLVGGFDQGQYFTETTPAQTRAAVRAAFDAAGGGGGFILSPSDHFFAAKDELLDAFSDEAHRCVY